MAAEHGRKATADSHQLPPQAAALHLVLRLRSWICGLLIVLAALPALACRYNVRDLGFIELESETCRLLICTPTNTPSDTIDAFRRIAQDALRHANLRLELVGFDNLGPIDAHLTEALATNRLPAAALLSPDGPVLALPLAREGSPLPSMDEAALRALVDSPTRDEIVRETSRRFGVVLLIEGTDPAQNAVARQAVAEAIAGIRKSLASLPKAITQPPALVTLPTAVLAREQVLLWSLRLTPEPTPEPRAAIIYGKARWIGPLMKGREIAVGNLTRLFSIVGADCECGLDLSWTRGTTLPVRWSVKAHAAATKSLGFDPLDPLVHLETTRILDRFSSSLPDTPRTTKPGPSTPAASGSVPPGAAAYPPPALAAVAPLPPSSSRQSSGSSWKTTWIVAGLLAGGVAAASAWLWHRRAQR